MAINKTPTVDFLFENTNGRVYNVSINRDTGAGIARLMPKVNNKTVYDAGPFDQTETTVAVDGASLAAWKNYHLSRKIHAAVYNTGVSLNTRLNAA